MSADDRAFLIWSLEHDAWWRGNWTGYTRELSEAGVYSAEAAKEILEKANGGGRRFHECAIPRACTFVEARALLATIRDDASSADLLPIDRELLAAIDGATTAEEILAFLHSYYSDLDRANRTPRAFLYLHIGLLIGLIQREAIH